MTNLNSASDGESQHDVVLPVARPQHVEHRSFCHHNMFKVHKISAYIYSVATIFQDFAQHVSLFYNND